VLGWLFASALAAPSQPLDDVDQQIIVWGDPFLRWDHRFYVETEIKPVVPLRVPAFRNTQVRLIALQIRAVLDCDRFAPQGTHQLEVRCRIEDIGLLGMPHLDDDLPRHRRILPEIDATLTGVQVELQVNDKGRVFDLGIHGMETTVWRTRLRQEVLRQIVWRLMAPFDLKLPEPIVPSTRWTTYKSALFSWPSHQTPQGSAILNHFMSPYEGHLLVQTIGRGMFEDGHVMADMLEDRFEPVMFNEIDKLRLDLETDGVALFEIQTGILIERVFSVRGKTTASSGSSIVPRTYVHHGSLRMVGAADRPDVGDSKLVSREVWQVMGHEPPVDAEPPPAPPSSSDGDGPAAPPAEG